MRPIVILMLILGWCTSSIAQEVLNKTIPVAKGTAIYLDFTYADAKISAWDKDEVSITGQVSINNGEANDHFEIDVKQDGRVKIITGIRDIDGIPRIYVVRRKGQKYYFDDEKKAKTFRKETGDADFYSTGHDIEVILEIKVPRTSALEVESKYGDVDLLDVSAGLSVNNTYGHIDVSFSDFTDIGEEIYLKSTYDFVDISLPLSSRASFVLKSNYGEIFTDLDLKVGEGSRMKQFSSLIRAALNGGGKEIQAESTYNNVYVRKT